jgi:type I restriction enzyme R subunit
MKYFAPAVQLGLTATPKRKENADTYVAFALPPINREERAAMAKIAISTQFNSKQQAFLDFVLSHYVRVGVEELDQEKLTPLLRLKYHNSISDALADLGQEIGHVFVGFQKYLYQLQAAA